MTFGAHNLACKLIPLACAFSGAAAATPEWTEFAISADSTLFATHVVPDRQQRIREARVASALNLALDSGLFQLDTAYTLQSRVDRNMVEARNGVSEQLRARLHSQALDQMLGVQLGVNADGLRVAGGDSYRSRLAPVLSASIDGLARIDLGYEYRLEKPAENAVESTYSGYSVQLEGSLPWARDLSWSGRYSNADIFDDGSAFTRNVESYTLVSTYRFSESLELQLSAAVQENQKVLEAVTESSQQERYGTSLAWSPSPLLSLGLRLNALEQSLDDSRELFGGGELTFSPQPSWELSFSYGLQPAQEEAAWMLRTRYDFGG
ncbi:hypothetical protein E4634_06565 [Mangrovimicrobium sediminis]|uniref:DUF481 domain-containing protein n=1 Tax=Mangrovimicrobium sediminis TaxID=2562682 RepID=A0A4Z0M5T2_9GAMM|nr:hypothetical protein [Haliea sp. SAOS-164]TGD74851.1 hypothetical protein E4634_06565 [Haliea sp. SAOS-164]